MLINVIEKTSFLNASNWTAASFNPVKEISIKNGTQLVPLKEIVKERKENKRTSKELTDSVFLGLEDVEPNIGLIKAPLDLKGRTAKAGSKRFFCGDILYGRLRPSLNKVVYINAAIPEGACSNEFIVLECTDPNINPEYLTAALRFKEINERITKLIRGASLPRVNLSDLLEVAIPVPSKSIQKQIVTFIQEKQNEYLSCIHRIKSIPIEMNTKLEKSLLN